MKKRRIALLAGVAALTLGLTGCGGSSGGSATTETTAAAGGIALQGSVGPGFVISLQKDGQDVTSLSAGTYTISVNDQSSSHNFHLSGPGVDEATGVGSTGEQTFTVHLSPGGSARATYTFVCDPHSGSMNGSFTVS